MPKATIAVERVEFTSGLLHELMGFAPKHEVVLIQLARCVDSCRVAEMPRKFWRDEGTTSPVSDAHSQWYQFKAESNADPTFHRQLTEFQMELIEYIDAELLG